MAEATVKLPNTVENLAGADKARDIRVLNYVKQSVADILRGRSVLEARWSVMDSLWRGSPVSRFYPTESSTMINEPYKMVSAAAARVVPAVLPSDEWFRLVPQGPGAIEPKGAKALMKEQFKDGKFYQQFYRLVQMCGKYGFCVGKVPWVVDRKTVTVSQPKREARTNSQGQMDGVKTRIKRETNELNRDRTEMVPLSIYDFVFDWRYTDIQKAPGCGDYGKQTREDVYALMEMELDGGSKVYQGVTREEIANLGVKATPPVLPGKDLQQEASGANAIVIRPENDLTRFEWWGLIDLGPGEKGDGKRVEAHVTILNDEKLVHLSKNNMWHGARPYLATAWEPVESQGYGIGMIEPIVPLTLDLNDNQNMVNAAGALIANPMVKAGDRFNLPDQQFVVTPGRVLRGEDISQLQPFHIPDSTAVLRANRAEIRQDIEEVLGQPRLVMGGETEGGGTATEFAGRRREANMRLRPVIENFFNDILSPFLDMCLFNNQQFLDEKRVVRYERRAGQFFAYEVTPEELASVARVEPLVPPQIELLGVRGQMMQGFVAAIAQLGPLAMQPPYSTLLKKSWKAQFGQDDLGDIWPEEGSKLKDTQREELIVMLQGEFIEVREDDNHPAHMEELREFMESPNFDRISGKLKAIVNAHYANHEMLFRQMEEQAPAGPDPDAMLGAAMAGEGVEAPVPQPPSYGQENAPMEGPLQGRVLANDQRMTQQGA